MKAILFVVVLLAALTTIACGIWVATSLLDAISSKGHPHPHPSEEHDKS